MEDLEYKPGRISNSLDITCTKLPKNLPSSISYFQLFRFSTTKERFIIILGIFFATVAAFGLPLNVIIYGEYTTLLVDRTVRIYKSTPTLVIWIFGGGRILTNASVEENRLAIIEDAQAFGLAGVIITLIQFVACIIAVDLTNYTATKLSNRLRRIFLQAVLHQDMEWYDTSTDNNFAVKITEDIEKLKEGTGDKLAIFTYLVMSFVICVALSFVYGWKLTLVILTCAPLIIVATALVAKVQATLTEKELKSYSVAGRIAEEVLSAIRTVVALGGQLKEQDRYNKCLEPSLINGMKKGLFSGLGSGIMWLIIYCCYALAFWYGVGLILDDRDLEDRNYTPAVLIIVLFGVLAGAQNLGFSSPHLEAFATAKGSARNIYSIIERVPAINSLSTEGVVIKGINGNIEFKNVTFKYPARTNAPVLQGLTFSIKTGTTVALVGSSGCGKSTCIQLLQRNYDPLNGEIKIDGMNITQMNVGALRSFIGVVGQEPVLFSTTIGENIRYGKPSATNFDVQEAAKLANCHDFISKLPNGYHTVVGERGSQLSGGQKQRIALARALIRNPAILLLDEATSALDPHSEKKVQQALNKASQGRTTIIVTHRLSTITSAHKIVYIKDGRVIEQGTHTQLLQLKNEYYNLINAQSVISSEKEISKKSVIRRLSSRALSSHASDSDDECSEPDINVNDTIEEIYPVSLMRLLKINSPEWFYILIGCVAAVFVGASLPTFAILFGEFYGILSLPDKEDVQNRANTFSFFFIALGVITGAGTFVQTYAFNITGVRLTSRLRQWAFKAMLSQEMNWFDDTRNSVGALCARLSGDCASVQGATGIRIGAMLQAFSTLAFGIAVALFYSWKLTLVSLVGIPIVLAAIFLEARFTESSGLQEKKSLEAASRIAVEAISSIKTVASLGQEMHVMDRYMQEINTAEMSLRKRLRWRGLVFSLGQSAPFFAYSLALYYGGLLVANEGLPYENVIKVSEALIFGAWMLGQSLAYVPNVNIAIISAGRLLKLLDRNPKIVELPLVTRQDEFRAENITFKNIEFSYPSRVNHPVLQNFNLSIGKNQTIALVGPSGCGKSTCIQLLLRFYDPASGRIELNEVSSLVGPVKKLREKFGLVSQEPVLFDKTISENISYGDNTREISMLEIFEAAKMANIHDFIISLPNGYETSLGPAGTQLSGGQKQRIAIARALIRNPQILLLDEATSALDAQSEKVVQQALDKASSGRTCIIIAHRLSTVQNADLICVLNNGAIVECGTHSELLVNGKMYAKLHKMQQIA